MKTKVCGLTQAKQLEQIGQMADFVGMIFYPPSKRFIGENPPAGYVPGRIDALKTGVFVDAGEETMRRTAAGFQLDALQLHGNEPPTLCEKLKDDFTLLKVFRIDAQTNFQKLEAYSGIVDYFLFDTAGKQPGGNGIKFSWKLLQNYQGNTPFFLSGGIAPEDAPQVQQFHHSRLAGVDINSRFESQPGIKIQQAVEAFLQSVASTAAS